MKVNVFFTILISIVGIFLGMVGGTIVSGTRHENTQQAITDSVLFEVAQRDSIIIELRERELYYEEMRDSLSSNFDSIAHGAKVQVAALDSLINSDFESLTDSAKLAYKEKVLNRLRNK